MSLKGQYSPVSRYQRVRHTACSLFQKGRTLFCISLCITPKSNFELNSFKEIQWMKKSIPNYLSYSKLHEDIICFWFEEDGIWIWTGDEGGSWSCHVHQDNHENPSPSYIQFRSQYYMLAPETRHSISNFEPHSIHLKKTFPSKAIENPIGWQWNWIRNSP